MKDKKLMVAAVGAVLAAAVICIQAVADKPKAKDMTSKTAESSVTTNDNGSVSRLFTESTVTTNGNMVTERRRETRTNMDMDGNVLETSTSEYAQSYPVGDVGVTPLSAQTTDAAVNKVTPVLWERYPTIEDLAAADASEVSDIIRSIGFFRTKAANCVKCAQMVLADFGGEVPRSMEELQRIPADGEVTVSVELL